MAKPKPPPAHVRTHEETVQEMKDRLRVLNTLAAQFRDGEPMAAKLMATVISTMCHDGRGRVRSLISQLGMRDSLQCISTANKPIPGNLLTSPLMLGIRLGAGAGFIPLFLMPDVDVRSFPWISFQDWWTEPVYSQGENNILTRKDLIYWVRSTDGGGHFDEELRSEHYVSLKRGAGWKLVSDDGEESEPQMAHLLTVWAMGWEITVSLAGRERLQQPTQEGA